MMIFRIEDDHGFGMYSGGSPFLEWENGDPDLQVIHPTPEEDEILSKNGYQEFWSKHWTAMFFGFSSVEQIHSWLYKPQNFKVLDSDGFFLSVYLAPDHLTRVGKTQAVFIKKKSTKICTFSLLDIPKTTEELVDRIVQV